MGLYTQTTRTWLDQRYRKRSATGTYFAHMPIYGLGHPDAEGGHLGRLARFLRILRALDGLSFTSLLDVGGAEGYLAHVVQTIFGAQVAITDLSDEACLRAREIFGVPAVAVDSANLPFADASFDVVVCSEVLEHVEHPVETLLELCRVARTAVVMTTEEVRYDHAAIDDYLFRRPGWPHMERNLFHPDDLARCLPGAVLVPQCDVPPPQATPTREEAMAWLLANTRSTRMEPGRIGVCATIPCAAFATRARQHDDQALVTQLLTTTVRPGVLSAPPTAATMATWFGQLRDPITHAPLVPTGGHLQGTRTYPVRDGVPDFVDVHGEPMPREALERRLATAPAAQREAMLALRDRLFLPERWTQDVFDLQQREHRRGFWPNHDLTPRDGSGCRWLATGPDPWILTPCLQRPIRAVELELRIHNPNVRIDAGTGQIFWKGAADETFTEDRSILFPLVNDGQTRRYRIELAGHPKLPTEVQWLRLDLVDGPCEVDFLSLRFE